MTRWILAFDQGCAVCQDVVGRVQEIVGSAVEARGLNEPEVHELRHQAFGDELPWAPTLLAVRGEEVEAWTGPRMSLRLARLLGPRHSVQVIRALGSTQVVSNDGRRRFLKAVPTLAVGAFVLSGGTAMSANNDARRIRRIEGTEADRLFATARADADFTQLQEHVLRQGFGEPQWEASELTEAGRTVRRAVTASYRSGSSRVHVAYGVEDDGVTWRCAIYPGEGSTVEMLTVQNGRIESVAPEAEPLVDWDCIICKGVCQASGTVPCAGLCIIICNVNPVCHGICNGICYVIQAGVCEGGCESAGYC